MLEFYEPSSKDRHLFPHDSRYQAYQYHYSFSVLWKDVVGLTICKTDTAFYVHLAEDDCFLLPVTEDLPAAMAEPITPATLGPMACISRKLPGLAF